jgi:hypothetical protein
MSFRGKSLAILFVTALPGAAFPGAAFAADGGGNLLGWVEDSRGMPVSGVLISVFAKGMRDGGFVTVSDGAGRFFLHSLPAGSYTLRALGRGHIPAPAREVTVLPNQDSIFPVSLQALEDMTDAEIAARTRELKWLERHKRRSVLEDREPETTEAEREETAPAAVDLAERLAPWLSGVSGTLELVANSTALGVPAASTLADAFPGGTGVVRLKGKITDTATFTVGGLVAESGSRSWRMGGEFFVEPGGGHEIRAGAGYGTRLLRPPSSPDEGLDSESVGAFFVQDRWSPAKRLAFTGGLRHSYIGFVSDQNATDPMAAVEFSPGRCTHLRGSFSARTLAPGGDLLTLSSLAMAPAITYASADADVRPQRTLHYEIAVAHEFGKTHLEARSFRENTRDLLVNAFTGMGSERSLHIFNGGSLAARGVGLEVSRQFGRVVRGSVTYSFGRSWRDAGEEGLAYSFFNDPSGNPLREGTFHDVVAQVETVFDWTNTRVVAYYRVNSIRPITSPDAAAARAARFDVQLSQGLPFIGGLTRADWDLLFAFRNEFYDTAEGGIVDEIAVVNPPTRVTGGISVRF